MNINWVSLLQSSGITFLGVERVVFLHLSDYVLEFIVLGILHNHFFNIPF